MGTHGAYGYTGGLWVHRGLVDTQGIYGYTGGIYVHRGNMGTQGPYTYSLKHEQQCFIRFKTRGDSRVF